MMLRRLCALLLLLPPMLAGVLPASPGRTSVHEPAAVIGPDQAAVAPALPGAPAAWTLSQPATNVPPRPEGRHRLDAAPPEAGPVAAASVALLDLEWLDYARTLRLARSGIVPTTSSNPPPSHLS